MKRSPSEEIYFVERHSISSNEDDIVRLSLKEFDLRKSVILKTPGCRVVGF
jgi:hypothetical protein